MSNNEYQGRITRKRAREHIKIEIEEKIKVSSPVSLNEARIKDEVDAYEVSLDTKETTIGSESNGETVIDETVKVSGAKKTRIKKEVKFEGPPVNWEQVYQSIKEYRLGINAPVDTMGCERLAEQTSRFQTLVALMLSSQTKDQITAEAINNLRQKLPGGLNIQSIIDTDELILDECISKVGFHKQKAKWIKQAAVTCKEEYNGDIPNDIKNLMNLKGVGPKMAYLCMQCAWNINQGIGVDVHVHRITNRLGWCKTKEPEATRKALESWLPKEFWSEINYLLVGFGQTTCKSPYPRCADCPVKGYCPSANTFRQTSKASSNRKRK
ncbi:6307_t:CDS:2 [Ambispora gerdemannii]|uniref:Endonuclease III homolog n=1 Tax=Ambispora gerdemannii TaxID=144530 RepID=A0A9N8YLX0_9GLOM|nr:6307_t:CDS:2 [Ambispora gerdemannii]